LWREGPESGVNQALDIRAGSTTQEAPWEILATVLTTLALLAGHAGSREPHPCRTIRCDRLWAEHHPPACSNARPRACVELVIRQQRIGEPEAQWLREVPGCESGWNPANTNGTDDGLFQFAVPTFEATPVGRGHPDRIWSALYNTEAAAWGYLHLERGKYEWECTSILGL
jgi:hypothetical protein